MQVWEPSPVVGRPADACEHVAWCHFVTRAQGCGGVEVGVEQQALDPAGLEDDPGAPATLLGDVSVHAEDACVVFGGDAGACGHVEVHAEVGEVAFFVEVAAPPEVTSVFEPPTVGAVEATFDVGGRDHLGTVVGVQQQVRSAGIYVLSLPLPSHQVEV